MNNGEQLTYGQPIDMGDNPIIVDSIENVVPVRYDGMLEKFIVASVADADGMMIRTDMENIIIRRDCKNTYLLADAIVG